MRKPRVFASKLGYTPIQRACDLVGGAVVLAAYFGITLQAVLKWIKKDRVPALRCRDIEHLTRGLVTRYQLRPDVFGDSGEEKRIRGRSGRQKKAVEYEKRAA